MNPCSYVQKFLTKVPDTHDEEKTSSSTNVAGKSGYLPTEN
jgi:hypothetical protein